MSGASERNERAALGHRASLVRSRELGLVALRSECENAPVGFLGRFGTKREREGD